MPRRWWRDRPSLIAFGVTILCYLAITFAVLPTLRAIAVEALERRHCPCAANEGYARLPYAKITFDMASVTVSHDSTRFTSALRSWTPATRALVQTRTSAELPEWLLECEHLQLHNLSVSPEPPQNPEMPFLAVHPNTFVGSHIPWASFDMSHVYGLSFAGAWLDLTSWRRAHIQNCNFSNATLEQAKFTETMLIESNLSEADMYRDTLDHVRYEAFGIPNLRKLSATVGLDNLCYLGSPQGLVELRDALTKAGMLKEAREVNYSLRTWTRMHTGGLAGLLEWVFVALPVRYGESPYRPLALIGANIVVFALLYWYGLCVPLTATLFVATVAVETGKPSEPAQAIVRSHPIHALSRALVLSILFAFRIGWREFSVGAWIEQLRPEASETRTRGWMRTASGVQSLLSVYLLALCLLALINGYL